MINKAVRIFFVIFFGIGFFSSFSQESKSINNLERALLTEEDPNKKMDILIELTDLTSSSDPDRALDYANQTVILATEFDNPRYKLLAWLQLGDIFWYKGDIRSSMEIGNKAKLLASDMELDKEYAESLILIARFFSKLSDFEKSANLNFQALGIFEKLNDKKGISEAFHRIGVDYFEQGNFDKALEYNTQALQISREIKDLDGISRGLSNVAIVYASMGDYKNVKTNIKEAIEISKIIGRQIWVGTNYSNLATLYRKEGSYDTAFYYLKMANTIFTMLNNRPKLSDNYYGLSLHYAVLGEMDSSIHYANLTLKIAQENNLKKTIFNAAKQLRNIYQIQNDYENAFKYCLIESQFKDSLDIENSMARNTNLELLREFEKIEQENKIKQHRRDYILIIIGIAIVFIFLLLVIIIITRNRLKSNNEKTERRRLNSELDSRNKELTANVMTIIRKNEILSEMGDKLMDIQSDAVKEETKSALKKISKELQKSTDDEIWNEFDIRFRQVHGEFYDRLIKQFPDLSPNEQKICAFLRLNMSTKDISELTGQQITSIERARTRLRKKLGLANTSTNLVTFLTQM